MTHTIFSTTARITHYGSSRSARRVAYLTSDERQAVRDGALVVVAGCPDHAGNPPYRKIIESNGQFYARVPTDEELAAIETEAIS